MASSEDENFTYVPDVDGLTFSPDADYVYICQNETVYGTRYPKLPDTGNIPLVSDVSSMFLSEPVDVTKYGSSTAACRKTSARPAWSSSSCATTLSARTCCRSRPPSCATRRRPTPGSLSNTPPCYGIYMCGKVFQWLKGLGGLEVMQRMNQEKAAILYDYLDQSKLFSGTAKKEFRSLMNVPFVTGNPDLDAKFIAEAKAAGIENIKGHRSVGGMRASIYNAMPKAGVEALVQFMDKFERENA